MTNPLRDRPGIVVRLEFYTAEKFCRIVTRSSCLLNVNMSELTAGLGKSFFV